VRAAAISALAQFGASCPELLPGILVLLDRFQMDSDDEVRGRATYYYCILSLEQPDLNTRFILEPLQVLQFDSYLIMNYMPGVESLRLMSRMFKE